MQDMCEYADDIENGINAEMKKTLTTYCSTLGSGIHIDLKKTENGEIIVIRQKPDCQVEFPSAVDCEFLKFQLPFICREIKCSQICFNNFFQENTTRYSDFDLKATNDDVMAGIIEDLVENGGVKTFIVPGYKFVQDNHPRMNDSTYRIITNVD